MRSLQFGLLLLCGCAGDVVQVPPFVPPRPFSARIRYELAEDFPLHWRATFAHVVARADYIIASERFARALRESNAPWRPDYSRDGSDSVYVHYQRAIRRPVLFTTKLGLFSNADTAHDKVQSHRILRDTEGIPRPTIYWSLTSTPGANLHELTGTLAHELAHLARDGGGDSDHYVDNSRQGFPGTGRRSVPYTIGGLVRTLSMTLEAWDDEP